MNALHSKRSGAGHQLTPRHRALAAALLLFATAAAALDPPYLAAWPTADRVLTDHVGKNDDDTLARQLAAFNVLRSSIEYMAGDRRWHGLTADELRLRGEYGAAAERIRQRIFATHKDGRALDSEPSPAMRKWTALQWSYEGDPRFRHETLSRYLPAEAVARIEGETPQSIAPRGSGAKGGRSAWITWTTAAAGLLLLVTLVRRRRASRSPTAAAPEIEQLELPDGYADLSKADRELLTRAGHELLDSLEPYLYAAQVDGKPLPIEVLRDAQVRGYFVTYSWEALRLEGASDEDIKRMTPSLLFHLLVFAPQRMKRLFRAGAPPPVLPAAKTEDEMGTAMFRGVLEATLTLQFFKSTTAKPPIQTDAVDDEIPLELAEAPPATRLHPSGPNAAYAQRRLLRKFSARLIEVST